jgi:hypothetical protein
MGLTLKFYIGDEPKLTEALRDADYRKLKDPGVILAEADFALHLEPRDLNMLSVEMGKVMGVLTMDLRSQLSVVVDKKDRGLLRVSKEWVAYVAGMPDDSATIVPEHWAASMRHFHGAPGLKVTDGMKKAVSDLIALCQRADRESVSVLHAWWL